MQEWELLVTNPSDNLQVDQSVLFNPGKQITDVSGSWAELTAGLVPRLAAHFGEDDLQWGLWSVCLLL